MKKFLNYTMNLFLFAFFIIFLLLSRSLGDTNYVLYLIFIMFATCFLTLIEFMFNKCQKVNARRFYLISSILISLYLIIESFDLMFANVLYLSKIYVFIKYFVVSATIVSILIQAFYTFKDLFNKKYTIQRYDFYAFSMLINSISHLLIALFIYYKVDVKYVDPAFNDFSYTLIFNPILNPLLIISGAYLLLQVIIMIVQNKIKRD